jgi:zinc protease
VMARFGAWPAAEPAPALPGDPVPARARLSVVDKPGAPQTALRVSLMGPPRKTPDYPALQVMNAALGGLFSSRINLNLRETKGWSYGVFSGFRYHRTPGPFAIAGSVRTDVTGASVAEIFKEVRAIGQTPLPASELAGARDAQIYSLPGQFDTNSAIGASLADLFIYELAPDTWRKLPDQLRQVTGAQVLAAARKTLRPEGMIVTAVGDKAKIVPQFRALGLGQAELRDAEGQVLESR